MPRYVGRYRAVAASVLVCAVPRSGAGDYFPYARPSPPEMHERHHEYRGSARDLRQ